MRLLDLEYRTISRALTREAAILTAARPATLADALAKIEFGLRMQEGEGDDEASANIRDGLEVLRTVLAYEPNNGNFGPGS